MKLIVGLGNPGEKYASTRHNVGHMAVDRLKNLRNKEIKNLKVLKTDCFMNQSGGFVKKLTDAYPLQSTHLYVLHDDLDIPLGSYKLQFAKGPKDHNGLADIYDKLGTREFWHVRIGVDNRPPEDRMPGEEYVLQEFTPEEKIILDKTLNKLLIELITLISK
jgi:peptidyl-tRNA hydrolase, PTH1 family